MLQYLFNKAADLQAFHFIKKRPQNRCFHVKLAKFLRTPILKNSFERQLLEMFYKKVSPEKFANLIGKWLCPNIFQESCIFLKSFTKILRTFSTPPGDGLKYHKIQITYWSKTLNNICIGFCW